MVTSSPWRTTRQLLALGMICILISLSLFALTYRLEEINADARFRELAAQRIMTVRTNIDIADAAVALVVGHFAASDPKATTREQFRQLVTPTLANHSFLQGFSWDPRIPRQEVAEYEAAAQQDGLRGFRITERDAEGKPKPVGPRPDYIPVYYMEPQASNLRALGFDLASHPVRRAALEKARDLGRPQATGRITLVQENGDQYGVLMLAPVFGMAGPLDRDQNRQNLTGYVSGVFRIGDLISFANNSQAETTQLQMVDLHLFDQSATPEDSLLYPKGSPMKPDQLSLSLHVDDDIVVGDRQWQLIATPSAGYLAATRPFSCYAVLGATCLASVFFLFYVKGRIRQAERASAHAHDMALARRRLETAQRIAQLCTVEIERNTITLEQGVAELLRMPKLEGRDLLTHLTSQARTVDIPGIKGLFYGSQAEVEFRLTFDDGPRTILGRADWTQTGYCGIITLQDITARKMAEEERATMIARIAESDRMEALGTLAGGIAHEINTPTQYVGDNVSFMKKGLRTLLSIAANVRDTPDVQAIDLEFLEEELPAAADQALDGISRIAKIVQAIKEFSYPSSKTPHHFDLNHMVDVVATVTRNQWKYVAELTQDLAPDLPTVEGIEGELNQVLVNLIVNAAQAIGSQNRGESGQITIQTAASATGISLRISDDGPGISEENQRQIFQMFFTTKPPGQGTGQGLAIAKSIILRHGGQIRVESRLGAGATFHIDLPLSYPAAVTES